MQTQLERYLGIIGVQPARPSMHSLVNIVRSHLAKIPFENISKLYYLQTQHLETIPDLQTYLDGITRFNFGGTCYSNNFHLFQLLQHLGYDVTFCGADMTLPDVHTVNVVSLEGRAYLVDVGYAAPFFEPIPLDQNHDQAFSFGRDRYVLESRDENGKVHLHHYREGKQIHGYTLKPGPIPSSRFEQVVRDSFIPTATFMTGILLARYTSEGGSWRSVRIQNHTLIESSRDSYQISEMTSRGGDEPKITPRFPALARVSHAIHRHFQIPTWLTEKVLETIPLRGVCD